MTLAEASLPSVPRFVILLLPGARLSSWGAANDAFFVVNRLLTSLFNGRGPRSLFADVVVAGPNGGGVQLAHGSIAPTQISIDEVTSARGVFVANFETHDDACHAKDKAFDGAVKWLRTMHAHGTVVAGAGHAAHLVARACLGPNGVAALPDVCQIEERRRRSGLRLPPQDSVVEDHGVITAGSVSRELDLLFRFVALTMSPSAARWLAKRTGLVVDNEEMLSNDEIDSHDPLVARAQQWMRERYWQSFTVRDIAVQTAVSSRTLTRRFQKSLAMSPHQFLVEVRMEAAKRLIVRTQLSIAEVGSLVGYPDLKNFRQAFRAHTGDSPAQFRKGGPHGRQGDAKTR